MVNSRSPSLRTQKSRFQPVRSLNSSTVIYKLRALRLARVLTQGGCVAHATATLPGIAADPRHMLAVCRLQRFKQRSSPFLLLADSMQTALQQARYISPVLRQLARQSWPGSVTLIIPAKPGLHAACYAKNSMAIRVDASSSSRVLAKACGGLLLSSSLNRRGAAVCAVHRKTHLHFRSFLRGRLVEPVGLLGKASQIKRVWRNDCTTIRA